MNTNGLKQTNLIEDMQEITKENTFDSCLISSDRNNLANNNNKEKKKKKVKFSGEIIFIDVECWKKYNMEQTADENYYDGNEDEEDESEVKNETNDKSNDNKKRKNKKDNVVCTCIVI